MASNAQAGQARKVQRGRIKGNATRGNTVSFGEFGLQAIQGGYINATTIEACRVAANQYIRVVMDGSSSGFPVEAHDGSSPRTRMGTGKERRTRSLGGCRETGSVSLRDRRGLQKSQLAIASIVWPQVATWRAAGRTTTRCLSPSEVGIASGVCCCGGE